MNPLEILGMEPGAEETEIEKEWLARVTHYQPGRPLKDAGRYDEAMEAWLTLTERKDDFKPGPDGRIDWVPVYLDHHRAQVTALEEKEGLGAEKDLRTELVALAKHAPYMAHGRLVTQPDCDVRPFLRDLLPLPEFAEHRNLPNEPVLFDVVWRATRWTRLGVSQGGSCKPKSEKERRLWRKPGTVPLWTLTLNLMAWLLMSSHDRRRLVHHELCHARLDEDCKPKGRGHDMEENTATIARFGPARLEHAELLAAAMAHPDTAPMIEAVGWDGDQGLLFAPVMRPKKPGGDRLLASLATFDAERDIDPAIPLASRQDGDDSQEPIEIEEEPLEADLRRDALKAMLEQLGHKELAGLMPNQVNQVFDLVKADLDTWQTVDSFIHYVTDVCQGLRPTTERAIRAWKPADLARAADGTRRRRARG